MNDKDKKVGEIDIVDFNKLPDTLKYIDSKPKNNDSKKLLIVVGILLTASGIGIALFYLINFLIG
jgi:hypothetical protein